MPILFKFQLLFRAAFAAAVLAMPAQAADAQPGAAPVPSKSSASRQLVFSSPEAAVKALIEAARAADAAAMAAILGADARPLLFSGDPVADRQRHARFVSSYEEAHSLEPQGDSRVVLSVGKDGWPFPIPLVKRGERWRFDTAAGKDEILNRRIGANELSAIQAVLAYVDAQNEYHRRNPQQLKLPAYAQRLVSGKGRRDGLYFATGADEPPSPLGPLFDAARAEGYGKSGDGKPVPYHGYHFRILKAQGANAQGGAYDYVAQGRMIGGFALVAWPASYRNSGVMTFIVNQEGVVFEKDLGPDTASVAGKLRRFDPDRSWRRLP